MNTSTYLLHRSFRWLHDTLVVAGFIAVLGFAWVNVFGKEVRLSFPGTPVFARITVDESSANAIQQAFLQETMAEERETKPKNQKQK